jgi:hypothetical protein
MNASETKSAVVRRLLESVATAYGPDAFPLDGQQPDSPEHVLLTSAKDRRFLASIIALPGQTARFSVMVELYDLPEPRLIPFEIAEDGEFSLAEVVAVLGRYREWRRDEQADAPGRARDCGPPGHDDPQEGPGK